MYPADHGLPLVQLKERRRELVVSLQGRSATITDDELRQIADIQQTISAFEEVIADLDCELSEAMEDSSGRSVHAFPHFGRRGLAHSPA